MSKSVSKRPCGAWKIFLLCILIGTAMLTLPVSAADKPVVTVAAQGAGAYYLGEKAVLSGMNMDTGSTYLYITGPNLPESGGKLTSPDQKVVSGNADTFTVVKTNADKTWDYPWFTAGLRLDAGSYTLYAASEPKTEDQLADAPYGTTSIIIKKPYISANISSSTVVKGQPFTVTGIAEGIPPEVQVWIIGDNYVSTTRTPVNPDSSYTFTVDAKVTENLAKGQYYFIAQHPMADNLFDFVVSGDYVRDLKLNNGTNLFKITGSGGLQGSDAADALIAAISEREGHDSTYTNDTYTIIPFQVTGSGVTISAVGDKSYYLGEKVVFRGQNTNSDSTYLFMTGPNLPAAGVRLTSPNTAVVSQNPDSFTVVKTNPDKSWEYSFYTANLPFSAGTYTVYAASQPITADQPGTDAADDGIILKKPFIAANISSPDVVKGHPFTVTGMAEGLPPEVQVWIIGNNYAYTTKIPVNTNASFTFTADAATSGKLPAGQNYLFVQHPMQNNQFDIDISGDYVRNAKLNNGTNLFRITGSGSLQGSDAAEALTAAFDNTEAYDDTYTVIPFQVTDAGSQTTQPAPLQYAPIGAIALILGIIAWKRR